MTVKDERSNRMANLTPAQIIFDELHKAIENAAERIGAMPCEPNEILGLPMALMELHAVLIHAFDEWLDRKERQNERAN